jgi:hypothetical protein
LTWLLTWLSSLLTGPVVNGLLNAYKAKLAAVNSTDQHAVDLAVADLQAQIAARQQAVALANTKLGWVQEGFGWIALSYFAKIVVYDKMLSLGSTDPLQGDSATVYMMVVSFYLGGQIVSGVVTRIVGRFK